MSARAATKDVDGDDTERRRRVAATQHVIYGLGGARLAARARSPDFP